MTSRLSPIVAATAALVGCGFGYENPMDLPAHDALLLYYGLDEGSSERARDAIGGNDGTLMNGLAWTDGRVNAGLRFDGVDGYAVSDRPNRLSSFTVAMWVYLDGLGAEHMLFSRLAGSEYFPRAWIATTGMPVVQLSTGGNIQSYGTGTTLLVPGVWYHLAFSFDGTNGANLVSLYVNAQVAHRENHDPGALDGGPAPMVVGYDSNKHWWLAGTLDEFVLYDRSLTDAEVLALYSAAPDQ